MIYLAAFAGTLLLEAAVVVAWRERRELLPALLALNLVSHPVGWFAVASGVPWVAAELGVLAFEVPGLALLSGVALRRAGPAALLANLVSAAASLWAAAALS